MQKMTVLVVHASVSLVGSDRSTRCCIKLGLSLAGPHVDGTTPIRHSLKRGLLGIVHTGMWHTAQVPQEVLLEK